MTKSTAIKGFNQAKAITKTNASSFYFTSKLLPKDKQLAAYAVYAFCRLSDDSIDNQSNSTTKINYLEEQLNSAYSPKNLGSPLFLAFQETIKRYNIPKKYFDDLICGIRSDLTKNRYLNFSELKDYCYKVAGVVGLIMLEIFGYRDNTAKKYAIDLGIAMQLTNILRDIKKDYQMARIYLPQDEMQKFNINENQIKNSNLDDNFIEFLKFQINRARDYYIQSSKGINLITDRQSQLVVASMSTIYAGILTAIEKNNYDIFNQRAHTTTIDKLSLLAKLLIKGDFL